jgi:hypothetical protein
VVGGAYEHFKHKRREKRAEKRFKKQTKQLEQARQDYKFGMQEQDRQQAEAVRQSTATERRFMAATQRANRTQAERLQNSRNPEQAKQIPMPAQLEQGEQPAIPEDHRLESSAWHSIEIDSRTGKPVENPTFSYGHEYYRERAPENTPIAQRNAAAGEVALVAAASAGASAAGDGAAVQQPATQIPDASVRGQTPNRPKASSSDNANLKENAKSALDSFKDSSANTGPLWPWLLALGVIFILLVVLLH